MNFIAICHVRLDGKDDHIVIRVPIGKSKGEKMLTKIDDFIQELFEDEQAFQRWNLVNVKELSPKPV